MSSEPRLAAGAKALAAFLLFAVIAAAAVDAAAQPAEPPAGTAPAFVVQSANGDNRLQIGAFLHMDGRFFVGDSQHDVTDAFALRRMRMLLQGRVARYFDYFLNVDFAGGVVNVRDAQVDTHFSDAFRLRAGKFKTPFSYDRLILVVNILFVERGFTSTVAPDRDTGLQVLGDVAGNVISYAAALTNGVVDGGNSDNDTNDAKDITGRLVVSPFARQSTHPLNRLGLAMAANTGKQAGALPSFVTSGRQIFFTYAPGVVADGRRTRWSPQAFYYRGPFGGYGEYVRSRGGVRKGDVVDEVDHDAWEAVASYVLTGEAAGERNVRPRVNFDPPTHHWGALQLAGRVQRLSVSPNAVQRGFASPTASTRALAYTLGVNWYLNPFIKWNFNFERTVFDGDPHGLRAAENALLLRAHLGF
jgi:phosphate-selective porin OprO and OprP